MLTVLLGAEELPVGEVLHHLRDEQHVAARAGRGHALLGHEAERLGRDQHGVEQAQHHKRPDQGIHLIGSGLAGVLGDEKADRPALGSERIAAERRGSGALELAGHGVDQVVAADLVEHLRAEAEELALRVGRASVARITDTKSSAARTLFSFSSVSVNFATPSSPVCPGSTCAHQPPI